MCLRSELARLPLEMAVVQVRIFAPAVAAEEGLSWQGELRNLGEFVRSGNAASLVAEATRLPRQLGGRILPRGHQQELCALLEAAMVPEVEKVAVVQGDGGGGRGGGPWRPWWPNRDNKEVPPWKRRRCPQQAVCRQSLLLKLCAIMLAPCAPSDSPKPRLPNSEILIQILRVSCSQAPTFPKSQIPRFPDSQIFPNSQNLSFSNMHEKAAGMRVCVCEHLPCLL